MLNKYKTRYNGRDLNITIGLSSTNELNGLSQGISDFIEDQTGLSINPATDGEKIKYLPTTNKNYIFNFYNTTTSGFSTSLINAGFEYEDLIEYRQSLLKSFYLFQLYDSTITESQILYHTGYYNGFTFLSGSTNYTITPSAEISGYYLTNTMLSNLTGNSMFLKISFYNAKTGRLQVFENFTKLAVTTEDKFYFDVTLNKTNMTYDVISPINAREFVNTMYINKLNENVPSFTYEQPTYPSGGTYLSGNTYFNATI